VGSAVAAGNRDTDSNGGIRDARQSTARQLPRRRAGGRDTDSNAEPSGHTGGWRPQRTGHRGAIEQTPAVWDRTIELVVLTHPHEDHLTGLLEVLQRYKVKQVLYLDTDTTRPMRRNGSFNSAETHQIDAGDGRSGN